MTVIWRSCALLIILSFLLSVIACTAGPRTGETTSTPTTTVDDPIQESLTLESYGKTINQLLQDSSFKDSYVDLYIQEGQVIVLVTDSAQATRSLLIEAGIPAPPLEVRRVDNSMAALQQAEVVALDWLDQSFRGAGGVAIDTSGNYVTIAVEREPLIEIIGYDPGDQPVPYEQWPESLKTALEARVPGVDVRLYAGISETSEPRDDGGIP
jgi:hypothetical protein